GADRPRAPAGPRGRRIAAARGGDGPHRLRQLPQLGLRAARRRYDPGRGSGVPAAHILLPGPGGLRVGRRGGGGRKSAARGGGSRRARALALTLVHHEGRVARVLVYRSSSSSSSTSSSSASSTSRAEAPESRAAIPLEMTSDLSALSEADLLLLAVPAAGAR